MPLFQAVVTEMVSLRRWYFVKARNLDEAQSKLNVGDTFEEQDILGSAEVHCRIVDPDSIERAPFREKKKPQKGRKLRALKRGAHEYCEPGGNTRS